MLGVKIRLPFLPAINVRTPQLAISPSPTVLIGIAEPFIVSIKANAACTLPPGELIISVSSFGRSFEGNRFFSIIQFTIGLVDSYVNPSAM